MWWQEGYRYLDYDPKDETYFGCKEVVRAEWDYVLKRRASQAAAGEDAGEPDEETAERLVIAQSDGKGRFWLRMIPVWVRVKRSARKSTQARTEAEAHAP